MVLITEARLWQSQACIHLHFLLGQKSNPGSLGRLQAWQGWDRLGNCGIMSPGWAVKTETENPHGSPTGRYMLVPEGMCPRDLEVVGHKDNFQGLTV